MIITQLCLALSDLALRMTTWEQPLTDLSSKLSPLTFVEVATLMPQEIGNGILRLGRARTTEMLEHFKNFSPMVLDFLVSYRNYRQKGVLFLDLYPLFCQLHYYRN